MIRISELKLPLSAVPVDTRRAADAPAETDEDRIPPPHPIQELRRLTAQALGVALTDIADLQVFKRSFDARKAELMVVYIVDVRLADADSTPALLARHTSNPHITATPDMTYQPVGKAPPDLVARPVDVTIATGHDAGQIAEAFGRTDADLVIINPPFHAGHTMSDDVAWNMIRAARHLLSGGGELWLVGNRNLAYHAKLKRSFSAVEAVASNATFVVLRAATKPFRKPTTA